ncbi:MAG: lipocalin family protein [Oscillospiraceae bacterium]|nr:lipocalin family protein [Oscillospiraceae bacterium]
MKAKKYLVLVILVFIIAIGSLSACSSNETSAIVGRWIAEEDSPSLDRDVRTDEIELFDDETGLFGGHPITSWRLADDRLILIGQHGSVTLNYELSGNILILTNERLDVTVTFTRHR